MILVWLAKMTVAFDFPSRKICTVGKMPSVVSAVAGIAFVLCLVPLRGLSESIDVSVPSVAPNVCTDRYLVINASGDYVVNCSLSVNVTINPSIEGVSINMTILSAFERFDVSSPPSGSFALMNITVALVAPCRDAAFSDRGSLAGVNLSTLPICGRVAVNSTHVNSMSVTLAGIILLSSLGNDSASVSPLLWVSPLSSLQSLSVSMEADISAQGASPRLLLAEGSIATVSINWRGGALNWQYHGDDDRDQHISNVSVLHGLIDVTSANVNIANVGSLFIRGACSAAPASGISRALFFVGLPRSTFVSAHKVTLQVTGGTVVLDDCAALISVTPFFTDTAGPAPFATASVTVGFLSVSLTGSQKSTFFEVASNSIASVFSVALNLIVNSGNISLRDAASMLRLTAAWKGRVVCSTASNITFGSTMTLSNASLIVFASELCEPSATLCGATIIGTNVVVTSSEVLLLSTRSTSPSAPSTFTPWLIHAQGASSSVSESNFVLLGSALFTVADATSDTALIFPLFAWTGAMSEPAPSEAWNPTSLVYSTCTSRVNLRPSSSSQYFGTIDVNLGSALRGIPETSIDSRSTCATGGFVNCSGGVTPFELVGIHVVHCPMVATSPKAYPSNSTFFAQAQIVANMMLGFQIYVDSGETSLFLVQQQAIVSLVIDSPFNGRLDEGIFVNVTLSEFSAVVLRKLLATIDTNMIRISAPPRNRLNILLLQDLEEAKISLSSGTGVPVVVVTGEFSATTNITVFGAINIGSGRSRIFFLNPTAPSFSTEQPSIFITISATLLVALSGTSCSDDAASLVGIFVLVASDVTAVVPFPMRIEVYLADSSVTITALCTTLVALANIQLLRSFIEFRRASVGASSANMMIYLDRSSMVESTLRLIASRVQISSVIVIRATAPTVVCSDCVVSLNDSTITAPSVDGNVLIEFRGPSAGLFQIVGAAVEIANTSMQAPSSGNGWLFAMPSTGSALITGRTNVALSGDQIRILSPSSSVPVTIANNVVWAPGNASVTIKSCNITTQMLLRGYIGSSTSPKYSPCLIPCDQPMVVLNYTGNYVFDCDNATIGYNYEIKVNLTADRQNAELGMFQLDLKSPFLSLNMVETNVASIIIILHQRPVDALKQFWFDKPSPWIHVSQEIEVPSVFTVQFAANEAFLFEHPTEASISQAIFISFTNPNGRDFSIFLEFQDNSTFVASSGYPIIFLAPADIGGDIIITSGVNCTLTVRDPFAAQATAIFISASGAYSTVSLRIGNTSTVSVTSSSVQSTLPVYLLQILGASVHVGIDNVYVEVLQANVFIVNNAIVVSVEDSVPVVKSIVVLLDGVYVGMSTVDERTSFIAVRTIPNVNNAVSSLLNMHNVSLSDQSNVGVSKSVTVLALGGVASFRFVGSGLLTASGDPASSFPLVVVAFSGADIAEVFVEPGTHVTLLSATWVAHASDHMDVMVGDASLLDIAKRSSLVEHQTSLCFDLNITFSARNVDLRVRSSSNVMSMICPRPTVVSPLIWRLDGGTASLTDASSFMTGPGPGNPGMNWINVAVVMENISPITVSVDSTIARWILPAIVNVTNSTIQIGETSNVVLIDTVGTGDNATIATIIITLLRCNVALSAQNNASVLRQITDPGGGMWSPTWFGSRIVLLDVLNSSVIARSFSALVSAINSSLCNIHVRCAQSAVLQFSNGYAGVVLFALPPPLNGEHLNVANSSFNLEEHTSIAIPPVDAASWFIMVLSSNGVALPRPVLDVLPSTEVVFKDFTVILGIMMTKPLFVYPALNLVNWNASITIGCNSWWRYTIDQITTPFNQANTFAGIPSTLVKDECGPCESGVLTIVNTVEYVLDCPAVNGVFPFVAIAIQPSSPLAVVSLTIRSPFSSLNVSGYAASIVVIVGGNATIQHTMDKVASRSRIVVGAKEITILSITMSARINLWGTPSFPFVNVAHLPAETFVFTISRACAVVIQDDDSQVTDFSALMLRALTVSNTPLIQISMLGDISVSTGLQRMPRMFLQLEAQTVSLPIVSVDFDPNNSLLLPPQLQLVVLEVFYSVQVMLSVAGTSNFELPDGAIMVRIAAALANISIDIFGGAVSKGQVALATGSYLVDATAVGAVTLHMAIERVLTLSGATLVGCNALALGAVMISAGSSLAMASGSRVILATPTSELNVSATSAALELSDGSAILHAVNDSPNPPRVSFVVAGTSILLKNGSSLVNGAALKTQQLVFGITRSPVTVNGSSSLHVGGEAISITLDVVNSSLSLEHAAYLLMYRDSMVAIEKSSLMLSGTSVNLSGEGCGLIIAANGSTMTSSAISLSGTAVDFVSAASSPQKLPSLFYNIPMAFVSVAIVSPVTFKVQYATTATVCPPRTTILQQVLPLNLSFGNTQNLWWSGSSWSVIGCFVMVEVSHLDASAACPTSPSPPLKTFVTATNLGITTINSDASCAPTPSVPMSQPSTSRTLTFTSRQSDSQSNTSDLATPSQELPLSVSVAFVASATTSLEQNKANSPPPPPIVIGTGGQSIAIVAGALSPATRSVSMQRSLVALRLANCDMSVEDPVDPSASPTQMEFGHDALRFQRGAALGNFLLCLALAAFCFVGAATRKFFLRWRRHQAVTVWRAAASLRFPGWAVIFWTFMCQPLVAAALCILFANSSSSIAGYQMVDADRALGSMIIVITAIAIASEVWVLTVRFQAKRVLIRDVSPGGLPAMLMKAIAACLPVVGKRLVQPRRPVAPSVSEWVDSSPHRHFTKHFGPIFDSYREERQWFHCIELLFAVIAGVAESVATVWPESGCQPMLYFVCAIQIAFVVILLVLRPHHAMHEVVLSCFVALLGALSSLLVVLGDDRATDVATTIVAIQVYFSFLELALSIIEVIRSGRAQRFARRVLMLSTSTVDTLKRKGQQQLRRNAGVAQYSSSDGGDDDLTDLDEEVPPRSHLANGKAVFVHPVVTSEPPDRIPEHQLRGFLHAEKSETVAVTPADMHRRARQVHFHSNREKVKELSRKLQDAYASNLDNLIKRICADRGKTSKH